jgi:hypothetical protein
MASASVHPLDTVFSASALIRALTRTSSVVWLTVPLAPRVTSMCTDQPDGGPKINADGPILGKGRGVANHTQAITEALAGVVDWTFGPGDKVMQVENDYDREVYNGDLGIVRRIDQEEAELVVTFDGRDVSYGFGELDELDELVLAYATTIHKSQGSEYPAVVIPLVTQQYMMLARNLLYTGVTRGRRLVVLVGQRKALAIAVRNQGSRRRWSKLREHLANIPPVYRMEGNVACAL